MGGFYRCWTVVRRDDTVRPKTIKGIVRIKRNGNRIDDHKGVNSIDNRILDLELPSNIILMV